MMPGISGLAGEEVDLGLVHARVAYMVIAVTFCAYVVLLRLSRRRVERSRTALEERLGTAEEHCS